MRGTPTLILLVSACLVLAEGSEKMRTRKKSSRERDLPGTQFNICEFESKKAPFYCYCTSTNEPAQADEVNCFIFAEMDRDDPMWSAFNSQIYLKKLGLVAKEGVKVDYIPSSVLRQFRTLHTLGFQNAKFGVIKSKAFSDLPTVSTINLNKNNINKIEWHAFETLKNLSILNLDDNYITELSRDQFYDVPRMQKLFINNNNVTTLHENAFSHLPTLQELELNNNKIAHLARESFVGLSELQRLDLRNNAIERLHERVFVEMPQLQELDLEQNRIGQISSEAFEGLKNLRKLRLSENKIVYLEPDVLVGAPAINLLDLRHNKLKTMTFDNVKPIITNFYTNSSYFYLEGNKLICDCQLAWIWGLRNETRNTKLREDLLELTCFLETSNDMKLDDESQAKYALDVSRSSNSFMVRSHESQPYGSDDNEDEDYNEYEDYNNAPRVGHVKVNLDGKSGYFKHLYELKPEQLPCPKQTREDLMASEQPSDRHEHSSSSSIFSFASGGSRAQFDRPCITNLLALAFFTASLFGLRNYYST